MPMVERGNYPNTQGRKDSATGKSRIYPLIVFSYFSLRSAFVLRSNSPGYAQFRLKSGSGIGDILVNAEVSEVILPTEIAEKAIETEGINSCLSLTARLSADPHSAVATQRVQTHTPEPYPSVSAPPPPSQTHKSPPTPSLS